MWSINLEENTLKITKKCERDLAELQSESYPWAKSLGGDLSPTEEGYLVFDSDACEHMDYLHEKEIADILLKHKVNGHITFSDHENGHRFWGYFFTDGVCTFITGTMQLVWS